MAVGMLAGCGGGSAKYGEAAEAAEIHEEKVEGELLLAKVEVDQADMAEARADIAKDPSHPDREVQGDAREDAEKVEHRCYEGDGLEQCSEVSAIEAVVKEMNEEVAAH
jgi:hypothetical protein